jgi:4-hydroxybenzoate polyprenyltransferase
MNSLIQMLKLIRLPNLAIIALTQLMVSIFLIEENTLFNVLNDFNLHILILSTLFIASAGYLINDYYDIKIDYVNKPKRVVIGKHIKRRKVLIIHSIFNFLGILLGAYVSWWIMGINIFAAFLLWLYSNMLKRLPFWGNLTVSFLTGLSVFIIYLIYFSNIYLIIMYAVFAFFISLIREIIKDLEDVEGDKKFGCKTLPITLGISATKRVIYTINIVFLVVVFLVTSNWNIFLPFFITLTIILGFLCNKIHFADKKNDYAKISKLAKIIMVIGISSMFLI